jgi:hypothetical protein
MEKARELGNRYSPSPDVLLALSNAGISPLPISNGGNAGEIGGGPPGSYVGVVLPPPLPLPLATGKGVLLSFELN